MEFVVDLDKVTVVLRHPGETTHVSLRVGAPTGASAERHADVHRLGDVLEASHVGRLGPGGDAFIDPRAVRFHAAGAVDARWDDLFEDLCADARAKGWLDEADGYLQAHVRWPADGAD